MPAADAPQVAVLDVNETLSDLSGLGPRFEAAGLDPRLLPLWFAATLRDGVALTAAGAYAEFAEIAVPTLAGLMTDGEGSPAAAKQIVGSMAELDLHADVADGLRVLAAAGVRVVTLSNGSGRVAESLLERAGLRDLVEACLSISDAGRWKPAPEAYWFAAERCGVDPGDMVLIAVHPWDIDGARGAGLRTGWLSRAGAPYPPYMREPEATGHTLAELARQLVGDG